MPMAPSDPYQGLSSVNIRTFDRHNHWCKVVSCKIVAGADQQAGKLEAYRIDRDGLHGCKAYFPFFMNNANKALRDVALHLFDRHGHLKQHLYGTFGPETNPGGLIFIRTLALKRQYQGKGIGCQAIKQLLLQLNRQDRKAASWTLAVMRNEGMRMQGFRPIEQSQYLACCATKDHRCWDASLPMVPQAGTSLAGEDESRDMSPRAGNCTLDQKLADAARGADYHEDAAGYGTGSQKPADMNAVKQLIDAGACADRCKAVHCAVAAEQEQCICYLLGRGADVDARDSKGSTPLHVAASKRKPGCVKLLLNLGANTAVKDHMLLWTAEEAALMVFDSIDDCISEWPCSLAEPSEVYSLYLFEYVPEYLRSEVSKEFAEGWLAVIEIIARLLEAGYVPTSSQVAKVTCKNPSRYCQDPAAARHFLRNGGRVEFALDAILSWSRQEHEVIGNGDILEHEEFLAENAKLVSCENDTDYNMVKKMLCNTGAEPVGPYLATLEDDCLAEETDGDSESMNSGSQEEESDP